MRLLVYVLAIHIGFEHEQTKCMMSSEYKINNYVRHSKHMKKP